MFLCLSTGINSSILTAFAGSSTPGDADGVGSSASFTSIGVTALDSSGNMFVLGQEFIRKIKISSSNVSTLAGGGSSLDGHGRNAVFRYTYGLAADFSGSVFVTDFYFGCRVRKIDVATGNVTTLAGPGACGFADGVGTFASFRSPRGMASDQNGNLFVADFGNCCIRQISVSTGVVSTLAGRFNNSGVVDNAGAASCSKSADGVGSNAEFYNPNQMVADLQGNLFVTDYGTCLIRKIVISSRIVSTFAGSNCSLSTDGVGSNAAFSTIVAFTGDMFGSLFVSEWQSNTIRHIIIASAKVTTISYAGGANALSADLGMLYVAISTRIIKLQAVSLCELGAFCPAGSSSARQQECTAGYFCPAGSSSPTANACPAGFYCTAGAGNGTANPCSAGKYCPVASTTLDQGGDCPAGYFCAAGADRVACAAGYFCGAGSSTLNQGGPCSPGFYCPAMSGSTNGSGPCPAGYFCVPPQDRLPCAAGTVSGIGQSACTDCAAGTYQKYAGQGNCTACASGTKSTARAQFCTGAFSIRFTFVCIFAYIVWVSLSDFCSHSSHFVRR